MNDDDKKTLKKISKDAKGIKLVTRWTEYYDSDEFIEEITKKAIVTALATIKYDMDEAVRRHKARQKETQKQIVAAEIEPTNGGKQ